LCMEGNCAPFYCDCYANSWANNVAVVAGEIPCAAETVDLCNGYNDADGKSWTADGCFGVVINSPWANALLTKFHCESAKCDIDGGTHGQCLCQASNVVCANYEVSTIDEEISKTTENILFYLDCVN
jgi:hypothetical protein